MVAAAWGAPVPVDGLQADGKTVKTWPLPGGGGFALKRGAASVVPVNLPLLGDKEREAGGNWRGELAVDVFGTAGGGAAGK